MLGVFKGGSNYRLCLCGLPTVLFIVLLGLTRWKINKLTVNSILVGLIANSAPTIAIDRDNAQTLSKLSDVPGPITGFRVLDNTENGFDQVPNLHTIYMLER